jgi:Immunity protein Imm1
MTNNVSKEWYFTDNSEPEAYRDGSETFPIESEEHLVQVLREYSQQDPRIVVLESPAGAYAFVGIGGPLAGVTYYANPSSGLSVTAKPKEAYADEERWFTAVGEWRRFRAANLMPVDRVIEILTHLFRTANLPDWVDWV